MNHEPKPVAILAARLALAYPTLSAYSAASLADSLCRIERAQYRHAVRCCSGSDGGYVRRAPIRAAGAIGAIEHDPKAEQRAGDRILARISAWRTELGRRAHPEGTDQPDGHPDRETQIRIAASARPTICFDPRGATLSVRLQGEPREECGR